MGDVNDSTDGRYADTPETEQTWERAGAAPEPEGPPEWPGALRKASGIDDELRGEYRRLWRLFRAQCEHEQRPCALCSEPIDYSLRHGAGGKRNPQAFEVDHRIPVAQLVREGQARRVLDTSLWDPSHAVCNSRRAVAEGLSGSRGSAPTDAGWPEDLASRPAGWQPGDPGWNEELGCWPSEDWEAL